jgi:hypothetical protein
MFLLLISLNVISSLPIPKEKVLAVPDLRYQPFTQIVYKKFQPQVPVASEFAVSVPSSVYTKIPGLSLVLSHSTHPMLYDLHFEANCRIVHTVSTFSVEFLYDDHLLYQNQLKKNDGTTSGSGLGYWFASNAGHFTCSRRETALLPAGTHLIDVGVRIGSDFKLNVINCRLTVKVSQYVIDPNSTGGLQILNVPQ